MLKVQAALDNKETRSRTGTVERPVPPRDRESASEPNSVWQTLALRTVGIQAKLAISQPDHPYEREADRVADRVMRMAAPQADDGTVASLAGSSKFSSPTVVSGKVQRKCGSCEEEEEAEQLHRKEDSGHAGTPSTAPPLVHQVLNSPGQPLDEATRAFMEPRFGHDFSRVRVHSDAVAEQSARNVSARAYTVGSDIVFGAGQSAFGSPDGQRLLAHELTHVVQQTALGENSYCPDVAMLFDGANDKSLKSSTMGQRLNGAVLQRKLVTENAGGCGVCNEARSVGSQVHTLIQNLSFPPDIRAEFEIGFLVDDPNGDVDGRLDLLELIPDPFRRTIEVYIGEIKPNNLRGINAGVRDLAFYRNAVQRFFKGAWPDYAVTVEFLDIEPRPAVLLYSETAGCPEQMVEVENAHGELYLYDCSPLRSQLSKDCCKEKEEEEALENAGDVAMLGSQLWSHLNEEKRGQPQAQPQEPQQQATGNSSITASNLARMAAKATLLGRIALANFDAYSGFVTWAFTGVYEGTRGYNLKERLSELAERVQPLALAVGASLTLASDLAMEEDLADSEAETAGVRAELTRNVIFLGNQVYQTGRALEWARSYSAVEKRVDLSEGDQYALFLERSYDIRTGLGVSLDPKHDNSAFSLSIFIEYEAGIAEWLLRQITLIFKDLDGLFDDDQNAWFEHRP